MPKTLLVSLLSLGIVSAIFSGTTAAVAVWGKSTSACQTETSTDEEETTDLTALFQRASLKLKRLMPLR